MSEVVNCKGIGKYYREQAVLKGLSFTLQKGDALLVTGPNGVGKTTLLSILAGLVAAGSGEIRLLGMEFNPLTHEARRNIGFAPASESSLFLNATVRENLQFWARLQHKSEASARLEELAERWGFAPYLDRLARELSSGFRRRVVIARAFLHDPALVLLDEPFAFLDNDHQERTRLALEDWLNDQRGALVVSSNVDFKRGPAWTSLILPPAAPA